MRKIKIKTSLKKLIMLGLIGVLILVGFLYYQASQNVQITTEEKPIYEYTFDTQMKYAVNVFTNSLYTEEKIGEDQIYLSEFIKSINTHFTTSFTGSEPAKINGEYQITAQVAGYTNQQETKQDIWSKTFELAPLKTFQGEGKEIKVEKTAQVDYRSYNEFAKAIAEVAKVNTSKEIRVAINGKMQVETPYETLEQPIQATILIPLDESYFGITKVGGGEVKDTIKETTTVTLPSNQNLMNAYLAGIGCIIIAFLGITFLTAPPTPDEIRAKQMRKLFTNYGSRMVGVDQILEHNYTTKYNVTSLPDLIKIADEIEKPLLYEAQRDITQITSFHVMQGEILYTYTVNIPEVECFQEIPGAEFHPHQ